MISMTRRRRRRSSTGARPDGGSATIEMLIMVPALLVIFNLVIVCGRIIIVHSAIRHAAQAAARSGSLGRTDLAASGNATTTFAAEILNNGLHCEGGKSFADITLAYLNAPGSPRSIGANSLYRVTISCTIPVLVLPGFDPNNDPDITITYTAYSPVDPYRCHRPSPSC